MSLLLNSGQAAQQFARLASVARAGRIGTFTRRSRKPFGTGAGSDDKDVNDADE
jgi:hypothetical protein